MKVAVIQPSYIPWLGYFHMVKWADTFIFYDDVQYDNNGWRNRNKILVNEQVKWLTLSIDRKSLSNNLNERILNRVKLSNLEQFSNHKRLLKLYYKHSKYLSELEDIYSDQLNKIDFLSEAVISHTANICEILNIKTKLIRSSDINYSSSKYSLMTDARQRRNLRLLALLKEVGCTEYMSGVSAGNYLDLDLYKSESINVYWNNYKENNSDIKLSIIHYLLIHGRQQVIEYLNK